MQVDELVQLATSMVMVHRRGLNQFLLLRGARGHYAA